MTKSAPVRVLILARGFNAGGAERQLLTFLKSVDAAEIEVTVCCFYRDIWHVEAVNCPNVKVVDIGKRGRYDLFSFFRRAISLVREIRPDVIYGYGGSPWLLSLVLGKLTGPKVVWGIRNSEPIPEYGDRVSILLSRASLWASRFVDGFIVNSNSGAQAYISKGYPAKLMAVIPNGIDTRRFQRDEIMGRRLRQKWNVPGNSTVIGLVARSDPRKDHETLLRAAALLIGRGRNFYFVCVGVSQGEYLSKLATVASNLGIQERVKWMGYEVEVAGVYSALDVNVICSATEGFPNTLCEAMACETPCVVTDVGDCGAILGELGRPVTRGDATELADEIDRIISQDLRILGAMARARIVEKYSVEYLSERTTSYFQQQAAIRSRA